MIVCDYNILVSLLEKLAPFEPYTFSKVKVEVKVNTTRIELSELP